MKKNNQLLANPPIELVEYGDKKKIELTGPEAKIFNRKFSKYLDLTWESGGECFVRAKNCAGILALEEHIIKISPKIPNANYYGMLKYALQLGKVLKDPIPIKKDSDFWQYLVWFFLKSLEFLFKRNLYSNYVEIEENLNLVRGKIDFTQHLLHNFNRPDKIYCRFTEFTMNVLENQLIKTTLHKLIYGFQLVPFPVDIKKPLRRFYDELGFVDLILTNPKLSFKSIIYTRLNNHYKEILQICELILREQSSELTKRDSKSGFELIVDTDELFQDFINGMLNQRNRKEKLGLKIIYQKGVPYDRPEKRHHFPDFRIKKGQNEIILDTKYYPEKENKEKKTTIVGGRSIDIDNIAQMVFYSNSTGIKKLVLLYPGKHPLAKLEIKNDIDLYVLHIDLEAKTTAEFEENCDELKDQLLNLI